MTKKAGMTAEPCPAGRRLLTFSDPQVESPEREFLVQFNAWATRKCPRARQIVARVLAKTRKGALQILRAAWPRADGYRVLDDITSDTAA